MSTGSCTLQRTGRFSQRKSLFLIIAVCVHIVGAHHGYVLFEARHVDVAFELMFTRKLDFLENESVPEWVSLFDCTDYLVWNQLDDQVAKDWIIRDPHMDGIKYSHRVGPLSHGWHYLQVRSSHVAWRIVHELVPSLLLTKSNKSSCSLFLFSWRLWPIAKCCQAMGSMRSQAGCEALLDFLCRCLCQACSTGTSVTRRHSTRSELGSSYGHFCCWT